MKKLNLHFRNFQLLLSILSIFIFLSFPNYSFSQTTLYGDSAAVGNGVVRTFAQVNVLGKRDLIGVSLTAGVLNNLDTVRRGFVLRFPVTQFDSLVNHMWFVWNPQGHGPVPPGYNLPPHFDFHFVTASISEREGIIGGPDSILSQEYTPIDHVQAPGGAIPGHGSHWVDSTSPVVKGIALLRNYHSYGFYRGKLFFFEAHVSRSYLLTNPDTTFNLKHPDKVTRDGNYPKSYYVRYNASSQTYNVVLQEFDWREITDPPLPVELSSFVSTVSDRDVKLNWTTASENNNSGFEIERSIVNPEGSGQVSEWSKVNFVTGHGNSTVPQNYSYEDRNLSSGRYNYRLKQIDYNGNFEYYELQNEVVIGTPEKFSLSQNYPNPYNPRTTINYEIPVANHVTIVVYDIMGKEVATLVNQLQDAGYYSVTLDGSNFASGQYFYKLQAGDFSQVNRMILLK
ncbi:MAG: T9SS type A sorting domain-containing protein [Bacteroidota bacterium]|nr:T9SS type A sorting domain-containing protein [Bacteroidota bacterium]